MFDSDKNSNRDLYKHDDIYKNEGRISMIVACDSEGGIGKNGSLPWKLPGDLKYFQRKTRGKAILMGRKTWESLPKKPLKDRDNFIVTRAVKRKGIKDRQEEGVHIFNSMEEALEEMANRDGVVIGCAEVYQQCLRDPRLERIWLTKISGQYECDVKIFPFLPFSVIENNFCLQEEEEKEEEQQKYWMQTWTRINSEENSYLDLLRLVLNKGQECHDRTGVGTLELFSHRDLCLKFDLRGGRFPLMTTKKVFFRGIVEELLWFLSGNTDVKILEEKGINIWTGNSTAEFMESRGLKSWAKTIGKGYGHQLRHWGGEFYPPTAKTPYGRSEGGIDQIDRLIKEIKHNPHSRRLILNVWNVGEIEEMALPPCHLCPCQFWVEKETKSLHCKWYQRSADLFLGLPFNIASYALLTILIAKETGLNPGSIVVCLGNAHIYYNHIEAVKKQLERNPYPFPRLTLDSSCLNKTLSLYDLNSSDHNKKYVYEDFKLHFYTCHPRIYAKMAI